MTEHPFHCLFLCTGNSARSILGECLLRHHGGKRFRASSAGSQPVGRVNPLALEVLAEIGVASDGVASKDQDALTGTGAAPIDVVITVCDSAANEVCPVFPGSPGTVHWGLPDPAAIANPDAARAAFREVRDVLDDRIRRLVELPVERLPHGELLTRMRALAADSD